MKKEKATVKTSFDTCSLPADKSEGALRKEIEH